VSTEPASDLKLEIGHVLFIDIVGYSKLLITEQSDQLQTLKAIVRDTEQVKKAQAEGKLLRLPTGDGGALVVPPHFAQSLIRVIRVIRGCSPRFLESE
jgi:hypothetical protein